MGYNMIAEIKLVMFSVNLLHGDTQVLSLKDEELQLPFINIDDNSLDTLLSQLIINNVEIDPSWCKPELCGCFKEKDDALYIVYGSIIPYDTKLYSGYWVPISNVDNQQNQFVSSAIKVFA